MWLTLLLTELLIIAIGAITVLAYLLHREQSLRTQQAHREAEERAELLNRIQCPEKVIFEGLEKSKLPPNEFDSGPWSEERAEADDDGFPPAK